MADIIVRVEHEEDYLQVEALTRQAFSYSGRIEKGGIGCPFEHWMVHELRIRDGIHELSLVAELNGILVGHIIGSRAYIKTPALTSVNVLNLGPLSVLPNYQRKGVGKALLCDFIEAARKMDYGAIMFLDGRNITPNLVSLRLLIMVCTIALGTTIQLLWQWN